MTITSPMGVCDAERALLGALLPDDVAVQLRFELDGGGDALDGEGALAA